MIKLRTLLLQDSLYLIILILTLLITTIRIITFKQPTLHNSFTAKLTNYQIKNSSIQLTFNNSILGNYNIKYNKKIKLELGNTYKIIGESYLPSNPTTPNVFNYRKYLKSKKIYYIINIKQIELVKNNNIFYKIKNSIKNRASINPYIETFILGDKINISDNVKYSYQENGISHLLAISGMHISFLSTILLKILKRIKIQENKRYLITSLILFLYLLLVGRSASVIRGVLFFYLFSINKIYYFYIKKTNLYILSLSLTLLINEYFIYDIAFQFTFTISLALLLADNYLKSNNYFITLLKTSFISLLASIPISLYNYYQLNILSIIYNLLFVPLITYIIFPLSIITFIIPKLNAILNILIILMEFISTNISKITIGKIIFMRLNPLVYIIYFIIVMIIITRLNKKKNYTYLILIVLIIHYILPVFNPTQITYLDVGQGDSTYIHIDNKNTLIDTGGLRNRNLSKTITIPYLKSLGVKKLHSIIITHGDYDHMGEVINIINNFKVDKVILNCGSYNDLEKELINVLNKKKIKYYSCLKELKIGNNKFYFLQTKEYDNENDNSNVIYTELNRYKLLFMGDAGIEKEKDILDEYNISDVDVLKVGHHGSKTSSSKVFISETNPKYSIISVGKDNRYGHPNKEVLNELENSKLYRTDKYGSIVFKIINRQLKVIV